MDIEQLRKKRLAELQSGAAKQGNQQQSYEAQQQAKQKQQEMINSMLSQVLTQDATARLNSIGLVKPEKAENLKKMIISMAQSGQIGGKLGDQDLQNLLKQVNQKTTQTTKFDRRRVMDSDSDDDY